MTDFPLNKFDQVLNDATTSQVGNPVLYTLI